MLILTYKEAISLIIKVHKLGMKGLTHLNKSSILEI